MSGNPCWSTMTSEEMRTVAAVPGAVAVAVPSTKGAAAKTTCKIGDG